MSKIIISTSMVGFNIGEVITNNVNILCEELKIDFQATMDAINKSTSLEEVQEIFEINFGDALKLVE